MAARARDARSVLLGGGLAFLQDRFLVLAAVADGAAARVVGHQALVQAFEVGAQGSGGGLLLGNALVVRLHLAVEAVHLGFVAFDGLGFDRHLVGFRLDRDVLGLIGVAARHQGGAAGG